MNRLLVFLPGAVDSLVDEIRTRLQSQNITFRESPASQSLVVVTALSPQQLKAALGPPLESVDILELQSAVHHPEFEPEVVAWLEGRTSA